MVICSTAGDQLVQQWQAGVDKEAERSKVERLDTAKAKEHEGSVSSSLNYFDSSTTRTPKAKEMRSITTPNLGFKRVVVELTLSRKVARCDLYGAT